MFWRNSWFKNPSIWLAESILAYISGIRYFPVWYLCRNTANNINFYYIEQIQWKLMTKVFFKFKKPYFWPLFDPLTRFLEQNRFFPKNSGSVTHNFKTVSSTMPKLRKSKDPISRKYPDRQQDGRTDRPYFTRSFRLPLGV